MAISRAFTLALGLETPKLMIAMSSRRSRIPITSGSSAFKTATPPGFTPSTISALARAIRSCDPKNSMCAVPTLPTTPTSGGAIETRRAISPNELIPISRTAKS